MNLLSTILESEGDLTQKITEAFMGTCEFTKSKFRSFLDSAWQNPQFVNCSAHLVSAMDLSSLKLLEFSSEILWLVGATRKLIFISGDILCFVVRCKWSSLVQWCVFNS